MKGSSQAKVDWNAVPESATVASLGFDSLAILDLIYDIQQGFGLELDAKEMAQIKTVGELVTFLQERGA
jgi:acyl carrier protein